MATTYADPAALYWIPAASQQEAAEPQVPEDAQAVIDALDAGVDKRLVRAESPARGLHDLAQELGAGLLAVGATVRGPFGRLAPGSVGMHLLHGAPCPVLVTPADGDERPLGTIGVAFDGRPESRAALVTAERLAGASGADLVVIGAQPPVMAGVGMGLPAVGSAIDDARRRYVSLLEHTAAQSTANAHHRLVPGPAGAAIADASADLDLLVTGSRGYGAARGVILGSVSRHLVDRANCPVIVVPRPAGD